MTVVTNEEINNYIARIESAHITEVESILPSADVYNFDIIISRICDGLAENINILRRLNSESGNHVLDDEINDLLKKYYVCNNYLSILNDMKHHKKYKGNKIVFAKTPAGNPYFKLDMNKVPQEVYGDVLKTLGYIINGVDKSDKTKVRYFTNNNFSQRILEYKGFQTRIFTTKLKGNVLCVIGMVIKKATDDKKIKENLRLRISKVQKQVESYRLMMNDNNEKQELLEDSQKILDDVMQILGKNHLDEDIEFLFPDEAELEAMVPYTEELAFESNDNMISSKLEEDSVGVDDSRDVNVYTENLENSDENSINIPKTSKKVKRRGRGLGKKTIARNEIASSIKGFSLEELMEVQNFITKLKMNKELNDSISVMYEGFKGMTDEQVKEFEDNIKYFKYDDVGRHK